MSRLQVYLEPLLFGVTAVGLTALGLLGLDYLNDRPIGLDQFHWAVTLPIVFIAAFLGNARKRAK